MEKTTDALTSDALTTEGLWICSTCAVERGSAPGADEVCPICADERQWVPADGQRWTTLDELTARHTVEVGESEPGLLSLTTRPSVGIGQTAQLVTGPSGSVLWDPPGLITPAAVDAVREHGPLLAVVASHPHMYGVQVEWARALGSRVLVADDDREWLQRDDEVVEGWSGSVELADGLTLHQLGGHFPGSAVLHWAAGAEGGGVLLAGDTIFVNPDRTAAFMRSYPNRIPLSGPRVLRLADEVGRLRFDRLYNNFGAVIPSDAREVVLRSAERHAAWCRGDHDDLT